jgi:hypothetical protein
MRLLVLLATTALGLLPVLLWKLYAVTRLTSLTLEQRVASFSWLMKGAVAVS